MARIAAVLAAVALAALPAAAQAHTIRVSVSSSGAQANGPSGSSAFGGCGTPQPPAISADGRFVAFASAAANLVPGDTNGDVDIFRHDVHTGRTVRVSVSSSGAQGNGNSCAQPLAISPGGRFVVFASDASNLVPHDRDGFTDLFLRDVRRARTRRVVAPTSASDAAVSSGGRFVAYDAAKDGAFRWSAASGRHVLVSRMPAGVPGGDFLGLQGMSAGGRFIVFGDDAGLTRPQMAARHPPPSHPARRRAPPYRFEDTFATGISAGGRFVVFTSPEPRFVAHDRGRSPDVFLRDLRRGSTRRISERRGGAPANGRSWDAHLSPDGRDVLFRSRASNLVRGDRDHRPDLFLASRRGGGLRLIRLGSPGRHNVPIGSLALADGGVFAFGSRAGNLVSGDTNGVEDVFVWRPRR